MRQLILDTETTGLEARLGHRIIEIGIIELVDRRPTGRHLHVYINPERDIDAAATDVHGFTWDMLRDKPRFHDVAAEFIDFARDAQWIIHNAAFDIGFIDEELKRAQFPTSSELSVTVVDTLMLAREHFPGKRNSLDALCERLGVANAHRTVHGALLDAQLLSEVYLAMTRGQESLTMDVAVASITSTFGEELSLAHVSIRVILPTEDELEAHRKYLAELDRASKEACVWLTASAEPVPA